MTFPELVLLNVLFKIANNERFIYHVTFKLARNAYRQPYN